MRGGRLREGQSDSPYLITILLIKIPRVEDYIVLGQRGRLRAFEVSMALIANKTAE